MKIMQWAFKPDLFQLVQELQKERIALGGSDTVLGLLAKATSETKKKLDAIKHRTKKPYLVLVGSIQAAQTLIDMDKLKQLRQLQIVNHLMNSYWPGPLTIIAPARPSVPDYLKAPDGTIGIRVPNHQGLLSVLKQIPYLFSTSANKSGEPVPTTISEVEPTILSAVDMIVQNDFSIQQLPSTIVDCSGEKMMVVRKGAIAINEM